MKATVSYIPQFDGIRAVSILLVFTAHIGFDKFVSGGFGVLLFFFISGYLITQLLLSELQAYQRIDLQSFFIKRLLRLYPPLLLMVLSFTFLLVLAKQPVLKQEVLAGLFYFENYFCVFSTAQDRHFQVLWSLAVEEHFYLFFPFVVVLFGKSPRRLVGVILALIAIPLLCRTAILLQYSVNDYTILYTYYLTHCRYDSILWGCLLSALLNSGYAKAFLRLTAKQWVPAVAVGLIAFSMLYGNGFFRQSLRYTLQGMALLVLVPEVLYHKRFTFLNALLAQKWLVFLGKISYSVYLFHWMALPIAKGLQLKEFTWLWIGANIGITMGLALFSYFVVEVPVLKYRRKYSKPGKHLVPAVYPE